MRSELTMIGDAVIASVKGYVSKAVEELSLRLDNFDSRLKAIPAGATGARGEPGERGIDGTPGEPGAVGERGPSGEIGAPGRDGSDGAAGPAGERGEKGLDGVSEDQVAAMVLRMVASSVSEAVTPAVAKAFEAIRLPTDGIDGKEGPHGRDGRDGLPGVPGLPGEKAVDGTNGKDGRDGFDLKSFSASLNEDGRTVVLKFDDEAHAVEVPLVFPVPLERGVFNAEAAYSKGDGVTYDGSFWFAQKDAPAGKPGISSDWRLSTKRGRDGKDGLRGEKGDRGAEGRAGKDLTQLGGSGAKW